MNFIFHPTIKCRQKNTQKNIFLPGNEDNKDKFIIESLKGETLEFPPDVKRPNRTMLQI